MARPQQFLDGTLFVPESYHSPLTLKENELAIKYIKDRFEAGLARALSLVRVSAPLAVAADSGLNDHLNGIEKPVSFNLRHFGQRAEIVQSLAKWKRSALADYGFGAGEGLYTDMNALRPDEEPDNLHSIYVDQWDWEKVISPHERTLKYLRITVNSIYRVLRSVEKKVCERFPAIGSPLLPSTIFHISARDLEEEFPKLSPKERENQACRDFGAVFVSGIGAPLANGQPHDGRAADYDDWITRNEQGGVGLNGDILVWYPPLDRALELSSMGIRVNAASLARQLEIRGESHKLAYPYHKKLMKGQLPLSIGGGIGQSRLCMFYLRKAHVGEVQASIWPPAMRLLCEKRGVILL